QHTRHTLFPYTTLFRSRPRMRDLNRWRQETVFTRSSDRPAPQRSCARAFALRSDSEKYERIQDGLRGAERHPSKMKKRRTAIRRDRKSTRLNSSHEWIS